jgi:hypothetical protein
VITGKSAQSTSIAIGLNVKFVGLRLMLATRHVHMSYRGAGAIATPPFPACLCSGGACAELRGVLLILRVAPHIDLAIEEKSFKIFNIINSVPNACIRSKKLSGDSRMLVDSKMRVSVVAGFRSHPTVA